jgi:mono/diheme cytochrome c family protein
MCKSPHHRLMGYVFEPFSMASTLHLHGCERFTTTGGTMKRANNITIILAAIFLLSAVFYSLAAAQDEAQPSDPAAFYKAKCVACHGPKAEKRFDASLTDEQYLDAILKGKKPEKPPNMPAYGEKGVTAEQAKALLAHMKQLKSIP